MGLTLRSNKQGITDVSDLGEGGPTAWMVPLTNNAWGTGATGDTGENSHTGVFSAVLLKGDFNVGFNGAIDGISIVNCLENGPPSTGEYMTLSVDCLITCNVQQIQFPQVEHLGNKVCEQLLTCIASFVTVGGECSMGDQRSAVGDLLVIRSGVDRTLGDLPSVRRANASVGGLWVWAWPEGGNASTPGD